MLHIISDKNELSNIKSILFETDLCIIFLYQSWIGRNNYKKYYEAKISIKFFCGLTILKCHIKKTIIFLFY